MPVQYSAAATLELNGGYLAFDRSSLMTWRSFTYSVALASWPVAPFTRFIKPLAAVLEHLSSI